MGVRFAGRHGEGGWKHRKQFGKHHPTLKQRAVGLIWAFGNRGGEGGTHSFGMSLFK